MTEDCQHIKGRESISNGTVKESWEQKGISELCKTCEKNAAKANNAEEAVQEVIENVEETVKE